jgi:hypothetical protein
VNAIGPGNDPSLERIVLRYRARDWQSRCGALATTSSAAFNRSQDSSITSGLTRPSAPRRAVIRAFGRCGRLGRVRRCSIQDLRVPPLSLGHASLWKRRKPPEPLGFRGPVEGTKAPEGGREPRTRPPVYTDHLDAYPGAQQSAQTRTSKGWMRLRGLRGQRDRAPDARFCPLLLPTVGRMTAYAYSADHEQRFRRS